MRAIAIRKGENPDKYISWELHKQAKKEAFEIYKLPYRVYYNYLRKRAFEPSDKMLLNPCYPEPGYPIDGVLKVIKEDFELSEEILKGNREDIFTYEHLKPEVKEQVDKIRAHYCTWHNEDIYGPEWKKIYLKFLKGYDFEAFNCFDFYGVPAWDLNALDVTNDDIEMLKNIFVRLKAEYDKSPEAYDYKEPLDCEEYYYLYTDKPFALKLTKEEAAGKVDMYKQMNMPMSEAEQEAYFKLHDVEA